MRERLISAIILVVMALGAVILGGGWLLSFFGIAMLLAAYEFYALARQGGYHPLWIPALIVIAGLFIEASLRLNLALPLIVVSVVISPLWELRQHSITHASASALSGAQPNAAKPQTTFLFSWALTVLGILYVGVLGAHLFLLGNLGEGSVQGTVSGLGVSTPLTSGNQLLGISLVATWLTDLCAYTAGWLWGRTPFFPDISPKKTREGAMGGILGGTFGFGILGTVFGISTPLALIGGLGIALVATAGDLVESLIKRNIGVKDSGTLVTGHGGVLDRLDSMLFALTFAYYYCTLVLGYR